MATAEATYKNTDEAKSKLRFRQRLSVSHRKLEEQFDALNKSPNFLPYLTIAADGGLDEVHELWYSLRYPFAIMLVVLVGLNLHTVISSSVVALTRRADTDKQLIDMAEKHLITEKVFNFIFGPSSGFDYYDPYTALAGFELVSLIVILVQIGRLFWIIRYSESDCHRWNSVGTLSWRMLPFLSSFSAMKMLHYVTPAILVPNVNTFVQECKNELEDGASVFSLMQKGLSFITLHVACLVFGFDAFMMKFVAAAELLHNDLPHHEVIFGSFLFLNQVLGVLDVDMFTKERLFRFIFGGEDSKISATEQRLMTAWIAILCRKMWTVNRERADRFLALILTFDDMDFQKLMLNERGVERGGKKNQLAPPASAKDD